MTVAEVAQLLTEARFHRLVVQCTGGVYFAAVTRAADCASIKVQGGSLLAVIDALLRQLTIEQERSS